MSTEGPRDGPGFRAREVEERAARGAAWTAIHTVVSVPIAFVGNLLVARFVGPVGYGTIAVLSLALVIAASASNLGLSGATIQWGAAAEARGDTRTVDRLLQGAVGYHLLVQVPVSVALVVVLGFRAGPLVVVPLAFSIVLSGYFSGAALDISVENLTARAARWTIINNLFVQVAVVLAAWASRSGLEVWAVRTSVLAFLSTVNLALIGARRRRIVLRPRLPRAAPPGFWRYVVVTGIAGLVGLLAGSRSEILLLDAYGFSRAVGIFALAYGVAAHLTAPVDSLIGPVTNGFAALAGAAPERLHEACLRTTRVSSLGSGLILAAGVPAVAALVPVLYGRAFASAAGPMVVLGAVSCLGSVLGPLGALNGARRRSGVVLISHVSALVIDAGLAVVLIPLMGIWGAITANAAASLVGAPLILWAERREFGLTLRAVITAQRAWWVAPPAAGVALVLSAVLPASMDGPGGAVARAAMEGVVGGVMYVVFVRLVRGGLDRGEREQALRSLPVAMQRGLRLGLRLFG